MKERDRKRRRRPDKQTNQLTAKRKSGKKPVVLTLAGLLILTAVVFSKSLDNDFVNLDDNVYVTDNEYIRDLSPAGIGAIFTSFVSAHYHPLTILSFAIDYHLWGINAGATHAVSVAIHLFNAVLVFWLLYLLSGRRLIVAGVAALLFAIHPMRVESVAWIAERKDVLYVFFFLASLIAYVYYVGNEPRKRIFVLSLGLFGLSLLAKSAAAALPLVLLVIDLYVGRLWTRKALLEKAPFFVLALVFGIIAIIAQSEGVPNSPPFPDRIFLVTYALVYYLLSFVAPVNQSAIIPFPDEIGTTLPFAYYVSPLVLAAIAVAVYRSGNLRRELMFGLLFFLSTVILILIKFPIGPSYLAERYTYIPHIGLSYIVGQVFLRIRERGSATRTRPLVAGALLIAAFFLCVMTWNRIQVWKNSATLFSDVIKKYPTVELAYYSRGLARSQEGDFRAAIVDYNAAIELDPHYAKAFQNRGIAKANIEDYPGAIEDFSRALHLDSTLTEGFYNRAVISNMLGNREQALRDFSKVIAMNPSAARAIVGRGYVRLGLNDYTGALADYDKAIALSPGDADSYYYRGIARFSLGNSKLACEDWKRAVQLGFTDATELLRMHCQ